MEGDSLQRVKSLIYLPYIYKTEGSDISKPSSSTLTQNIVAKEESNDHQVPSLLQSSSKRLSLSLPDHYKISKRRIERSLSMSTPLYLKQKKALPYKSNKSAFEGAKKDGKKVLKRSYSCPQKFIALPSSGGDNGISDCLVLLPEKQIIPWKRRCTEPEENLHSVIPYVQNNKHAVSSHDSSLKRSFCSKRMCLLCGVAIAVLSILTQHIFFPRCDLHTGLNVTELKKMLQTELYGQNMAKDIILRTLTNTFSTSVSKGLLILLFIGRSGTGKTLTASLLSRHFSPSAVHSFITSELTSSWNHEHGLQEWISSHLSLCSPTLLVFDDLDENHSYLFRKIDNIFKNWNTFVPHNVNQPTIFVLITSSTSWHIDKIAVEKYSDGQGLMDGSEVNQIIDSLKYDSYSLFRDLQLNPDFHIVPFLPLNRDSVKMCIRDYLLKHNYDITEDTVNEIADQMDYFPKDNPMFSRSGCKLVTTKVEMVIS